MTGLNFPDTLLLEKLAALLGPQGFITDRDLIGPWLTDWRERYHGDSAALLAPAQLAYTRR